MIAGFSFVHDDRTYTCVAEAGPGGAEPWWWFTVNRDGNRYAPFRATTKDTRSTVQGKIVAYYANHLAHRAMPESQHWARRPKGVAGGAAAAAPGTPAAVAARVAAAKAVAERAAASQAMPAPVVAPAAVAPKAVHAAAKPARPAVKATPRPAGKLRLVPKARPSGKLRLVAKSRPAPKNRASSKGR